MTFFLFSLSANHQYVRMIWGSMWTGLSNLDRMDELINKII